MTRVQASALAATVGTGVVVTVTLAIYFPLVFVFIGLWALTFLAAYVVDGMTTK